MDITFGMHIAEYRLKPCKYSLDIGSFLILGVGFVGDFYLKGEAVLVMLGEWFSGDDPAIMVHVINYNGDKVMFLFKYTDRMLQQHISNLFCGLGIFGSTDFDIKNRHGSHFFYVNDGGELVLVLHARNMTLYI